MDVISLLVRFGLTRQEATVYTALHTEGAQTGYEIAKLTGISRSGAYTTLASLVDKGATCVIEGAATRYVPLPPDEFCRNRIRELQDVRAQVVRGMPAAREDTEGYITIRADRHVCAKIRNMIEEAQLRMYISLSASLFALFLPSLQEAVSKGRKVVVITDAPAGLPGAVVYHSPRRQGQIRLICDSNVVLTGEAGSGEDAACLYSRKQNLVDVMKESIQNEIRLIEFTRAPQS